jgi:heme-degrading monooxygenase HmoA
VSSRVDVAGDRPAGLVLHTAGEAADGSTRIVTVWESAEHAEAFQRDRLFPAFEATGAGGVAPAEPERFEPFDYVA